MGKWGKYLKKFNPEWMKKPCFKTVVNINDSTKAVDLRLAVYVAIHCSVRSVDHLAELLTVIGKGSALERTRLHRTKCSKLIAAVIAPAFLTELIRDIGQSKYSLIVDEVTDITVIKIMGVCVRYYSKSKKCFATDFLGLLQVHSGTGENLAKAVLEYLDKIGLPYMNMESIGVDGAPVMVGIHDSFYTHLRDKIPHLILVKCICHSVDKAAEYAYKAIPDEVTYLVTETYNWFAHSSVRQDEYQQYYEAKKGCKPGKLVSPSKTRWLIWKLVCSQFLDQWTELKAAPNKKDHKAKILAPLFTTSNLLYLTFLRKILSDVRTANLAFEQTDADVTKLYSDVRNVVFTIAARLLKQGSLTVTIRPGVLREDEVEMLKRAFQTPANDRPADQLKLGWDFDQLLKTVTISEADLLAVRPNCGQFLLKLGIELCERLPANLATINKIKYFSPKLALAKVARPEFEQLPIERADHLNKDTLETQWIALGTLALSDICPHADKNHDIDNTDIQHFWSDVLNLGDASGNHPFEELAMFAIRCLTLPISNAVVERIFSLLNFLKSKRRNKLQLRMLEALIRLRVHLKVDGLCCKGFVPTTDMFSRFNSKMYEAFHEPEPAAAIPMYRGENEDEDEEAVDNPDDAHMEVEILIDMNCAVELPDEDYRETMTLFDEDGIQCATITV
ncbi:General transcription factor II-I repeat domain-containing protein 2 [Frankliniella fusca]|uniref:General transcription factor II-I repeat domain-containing protein 2 n=1 Tax=Frankliniella fusca TaxID=407009 RepID=A0AAE1HSB5_9NEOP|nr:General transcription factor II-I repeat domain-containing protein 2 [Frankliniella fusca]